MTAVSLFMPEYESLHLFLWQRRPIPTNERKRVFCLATSLSPFTFASHTFISFAVEFLYPLVFISIAPMAFSLLIRFTLGSLFLSHFLGPRDKSPTVEAGIESATKAAGHYDAINVDIYLSLYSLPGISNRLGTTLYQLFPSRNI